MVNLDMSLIEAARNGSNMFRFACRHPELLDLTFSCYYCTCESVDGSQRKICYALFVWLFSQHL